MKLFEIASGFIAAVVVALGVNHYVNSTKVGEEPVVKTEETKALAPVIFYHLGNGVYSSNQPGGTNCQPVDPRPCTIIYLDEQDVGDVEEFVIDSPSQPEGENEHSTDKGIWM